MKQQSAISPIRLELLAPAKDLATGIAAIDHGADAVYIAAGKFGAREKAGNSTTDIGELCSYAHEFYSKVYITVNTILYENELSEAERIIDEVTKAGADALIIQDFSILKMDIPPIAMHASTQMHNNTVEKIKFLESCGISRVVLPRELSLEEISEIRNHTDADLEFFIHGALCVCFSGQCYMSQALTGRSANRGACAQPCRSKYDLVDANGKIYAKDKYLLSLKDLNLTDHIGALIDNGITSFKIEGRMKDISYVKNTVAHYSNILNAEIELREGFVRSSSGRCEYGFVPDPSRSFSRSSSEHFINGRKTNQASYNTQKSVGKLLGKIEQKGSDWFVLKTSETVSNGDGLCYYSETGELKGFSVNSVNGGKIIHGADQKDLKPGTEIFRNYDHHFEKILAGKSSTRSVFASIFVENNTAGSAFHILDENGNKFSLHTDDRFESALKPEMAITNIRSQLSKTGGTIFKIQEVSFSEGFIPVHIPVSQMNAFRRSLIDGLLIERRKNYTRPQRSVPGRNTEYPIKEISYRGNISNSESRKFLTDRGVIKTEEAFEIKIPEGPVTLMETRYCIKFELGICPSKQGGSPTGKLFLKDNRRSYPLIFDCAKCVMRIEMPENEQKRK